MRVEFGRGRLRAAAGKHERQLQAVQEAFWLKDVKPFSGRRS